MPLPQIPKQTQRRGGTGPGLHVCGVQGQMMETYLVQPALLPQEKKLLWPRGFVVPSAPWNFSRTAEV
jgi:hypothetical protein